MFDITRIYSDDEGESHFEDVKIRVEEAGLVEKLSALLFLLALLRILEN
jgi:uncharacterized membrane protein